MTNTYNDGIEAAITYVAARADGLYEWMLRLPLESEQRVLLSTRTGELLELVHDLRNMIKVDA